MELRHKLAYILVGYPGSGKSTLGQKLAQHMGATYLSSDQLRQQMFGTTRHDKAGDDVIQQQSAAAYQAMYKLASQYLQQNKQVVLDATHLDTKKRQAVLQQMLIQAKASQLCYVLVKTTEKVIKQRLQSLPSAEYADWERVFGYFQEKAAAGLLSWPTVNEGIDCFTAEEVYAALEK